MSDRGLQVVERAIEPDAEVVEDRGDSEQLTLVVGQRTTSLREDQPATRWT